MKRIKPWLRIFCGAEIPSDYIFLGRIVSSIPGGGILKWRLKSIGRKYQLEIPNFKNIGENLVLAHGTGITINPMARIGRNCVVFKNATIGSIRSGKRAGVPQIGDNCVIGVGAFVCGGVSVGDDVLICANAFVDFDVPAHSIVLGNPGVIHHKNNATVDYMGIEGK